MKRNDLTKYKILSHFNKRIILKDKSVRSSLGGLIYIQCLVEIGLPVKH